MTFAEYREYVGSLFAGFRGETPVKFLWEGPREIYIEDPFRRDFQVTDPITSAVKAEVEQVQTAVKADVKTEATGIESVVAGEFDEAKVALAADITKARAVLAKFGIAVVALVVGWILGKLF